MRVHEIEPFYPDDLLEEFDEATVQEMLDEGWCEAMIEAIEADRE